MAVTVAAIFIIGGLLLASSYLLKQSIKGKGLGEDTPPSISTRGTWVPFYFGTRKTEITVVGWAGARTTKKLPSAGKGFGGGGSSGSEFYESVWHILGVGPAIAISEIRFNGKIVFQGIIRSDANPAGTEIEVGEWGTMRVYWGEALQPIDADLSSNIGVSSRWPRLCYVYWPSMKYGTSPVQPQVEYVVTWGCSGTTLANSDYIQSTPGFGGVNAGHAAHVLLTSSPFTGAAVPLNEIDNDTLEGWGTQAAADEVPVNIAYLDGPTVSTAMEVLLQDMGYLMPQSDGKMAFLQQKYDAGATYPVLTDDMISPPDVEREIDITPIKLTSPVFTFRDETNFNYRDQDIPFSDDGDIDQYGLVTAQRVQITSVTAGAAASAIARRRWQESTVKSSMKIKALRGARLILPGQALIRVGLGQLRVLGSLWSDESPITELTCVLDSYAVPDIDDVIDIPSIDPGLLSPEPDIAFAVFEVPASEQIGPNNEIVVFRIRAHKQIFTADIHLSTDDTTFTNYGQQGHGQGGTLQEAMAATPTGTIASGPLFEPDNDDITEVLNLTADIDGWNAGRQLCLINGEMFYVKSFDAVDETEWSASEAISLNDYRKPTGASSLRFEATVGGTTSGTEPVWPTVVGDTVVDGTVTWTAHRFAFRPVDMIRERLGTTAAIHSIGDRVFIADALDLERFSALGFGTGVTAYVKSQPRTTGGVVDLALVSSVSEVLA